MPTNVSFEFAKAKEKFENAVSLQEKMATLQEMQRTAPKHKGGEKLRKEISKKMSSLRREMEKGIEQRKKTASKSTLHVRKEGAGQVVLAGLPNTGKSTMLKAMTGIDVEVAPYPFTTKKPEVGMVEFKGAGIQLVEVPALVEGSGSGKASGAQILSIVRNADAVVLVLRGNSALRDFRTLVKEMRNAGIRLNEEKPKIEFKSGKFRGITIAGKRHLKMKPEEFEKFLKSMGIYKASVILKEPATRDKVAQVLDERIVYKKSFVIVNEFFGAGAKEEVEKIRKKTKVFSINEFSEREKENIKNEMFDVLDKVLVYTKKPGREADMSDPLVLKKGSKVGDVAKLLHKDFIKGLKYVKVWGSSKFPGQRVSKNYVLKNEDLIEIYS